MVAFVVPAAVWSDRFGRRRIMLCGFVVGVPWAFMVMPLMNTGDSVLVGVAIAVTYAIVGALNGPLASLIPETFATRYRYTGAGLTFNADCRRASGKRWGMGRWVDDGHSDPHQPRLHGSPPGDQGMCAGGRPSTGGTVVAAGDGVADRPGPFDPGTPAARRFRARLSGHAITLYQSEAVGHGRGQHRVAAASRERRPR